MEIIPEKITDNQQLYDLLAHVKCHMMMGA